MNKVKFISRKELEEFIKGKELVIVQYIIRQHTYETREGGIITEHEEEVMVIYKEEA